MRHFIKSCIAVKKLVEKLIDMGVVKLDDSPNAKNPLPNHNEVNLMSGNMGRNVKTDVVEDMRYRNVLDNKETEFYEEVQEEGNICTSELTAGVPKANYPMVIISGPKNSEVRMYITPKIIIQKPATFPYKDSKKVPWNYECNTTVSGKETSAAMAEGDQGIGFHTCSGKCHDLINPRAELTKEGASTEMQKREKAIVPEPLINEPIKEEEAKEFLKFLKHSEYSVMEQLHKQPVRTSVLALLLSSEAHRSALMKVLNETYVANDISVNKLDRLVNNISADNFIFFNDDEIPPGGRCSIKALHTTTSCKRYTLPRVLIDNGCALNVLPLSTLDRLPVDSSHMKACQNIVRAFDGTERRVTGRIEIPLIIGPTTYEVDFLVIDIKPSYNCLLGRPWIHSAGAVPSSLHQKLKLVSGGRLVTISAEEDIIATVTNNAPYVETDYEALGCSFQSLEFVKALFITEGDKILVPRISKTTKMGLQLMVGMGALPRRGLGRHLQGRVEAPVLKDKFDHFGLGYRSDMKQKKKEIEKRGIIHPQRRIPVKESINEMLENIHIDAIYEDTNEEGTLLDIRPYEPGSVLNNWTAEEIPKVFRALSESSDINDMSDSAMNPENPFE
ncbi:uncharacterized protein [Gossypium hirsutum]|uniref:G-patch domain-containing protein n=1 Tax=Gossypium hirsutum TaxID=3635 RepID=A0ABM3ANR5_GOSHI|nr:uncharacterized protein LOC107906612 [Gossypium hirsutum]